MESSSQRGPAATGVTRSPSPAMTWPGNPTRSARRSASPAGLRVDKLFDLNTTDSDAAERIVAGTARSMGIEVVDARWTGRGPCRDMTAAARSWCGVGCKPAGGAALRQATWSQPMEQEFLQVERPDGDNPQPEPGCAPQRARQDEEDAIVSNTSTSRAASIPATARLRPPGRPAGPLQVGTGPRPDPYQGCPAPAATSGMWAAMVGPTAC
jgi:hypothetical protein